MLKVSTFCMLIANTIQSIYAVSVQGFSEKFKGGEICVLEDEMRQGRMVRGTFLIL